VLTRLSAIEYVRPMGSGRTKPALLVCETPAGEAIKVVTKFSRGCDEGLANLAREVISACLAAGLDLPIPQPFLVEVAPEWSRLERDRFRLTRTRPAENS